MFYDLREAELRDELKKAESYLDIVLTIEEKLEKFSKEIEDLELNLSNILDDDLTIKDHLCDWIDTHITYSKSKLDELICQCESALERY
jgi:bacterioferritin (cytochrome b1)